MQERKPNNARPRHAMQPPDAQSPARQVSRQSEKPRDAARRARNQAAGKPARQRPAAQAQQRSARPAGPALTRKQLREAKLRRQKQIRLYAAVGAAALVLIVVLVLALRPSPVPDDPARVVSAAVDIDATIDPNAVDPGDVDDPDADVPEDESAGTIFATDDPSIDDVLDLDPSEVETGMPSTTLAATEDAGAAEGSVAQPGQLRSARFRVVGDIMICKTQLQQFKDSGYDFHPQFDYIKDMLANADYTMGNMEGTVGKYKDKDYSGFPQFNCPETILEALKDTGFDFLTLANNHMLDRYFEGLQTTVANVREYGFDYVGAYCTPEERRKPMIYDVNGIKVGFVAYTATTNGIEKICAQDVKDYAVPYMYKGGIATDIQRLRNAGAEVVIAFPHWGLEYQTSPDDSQKMYAEKLARAGADIILGSHPHMVQRMGYVTYTDDSGVEHKSFLMFSLGNFLSDHIKKQCDCGIIVDFTINEQPDGSFTCDNVGYIPTYCWQPTRGDARILPSADYLDDRPYGMSDKDYQRMLDSYKEITERMGVDFPILRE